MQNAKTVFNLHFEPLIPETWLFVLAGMAFAAFALAFFRNRHGMILRGLTCAAFFFALCGPSLLEEKRQPATDVAAVVLDESFSQSFGDRAERARRVLEHIQKEAARHAGLELRVVKAGAGAKSDTRLFEPLDAALADVPRQRRAGAIFITDGQVHDIPHEPDASQYGPVQLLLTGEKNETDRQIVITSLPAYGIVGQNVFLRYRVEDSASIPAEYVPVTLTLQGGQPEAVFVPPGEEQEIEIPITHAGQNVIEISAGAAESEITTANNRTALIVNGVRDRLRVLLVSGKPYAGGRTWRDLLTSDPGVDLVHFTILREPEKLDSTPQNELSLIAFPFRELFEVKLYDFDLIIFDQYQLNRILPDFYFNNIARYVKEGGAFLEVSGPAYGSRESVYYTALMDILPGAPAGALLEKPFMPAISESGRHHPVTRSLQWKNPENAQAPWGRWLRQVSISAQSGDVLMSGINDTPLLLLDRVDKGRVAQIASDQIWLWSRGYEGGGPHSELLRRLIHWLMKEPELDEKALDISTDGTHITIRAYDYKRGSLPVKMTKPDGSIETITLEKTADESLQAELEADQPGVYAFETGDGEKRFAVVGDVNPPELRGVRTTPNLLAPLVRASGGGSLWLEDNAAPSTRYASGAGHAGGSRINLRKNGDYTVTGVEKKPAFPAWGIALVLLLLTAAAWRREGRSL